MIETTTLTLNVTEEAQVKLREVLEGRNDPSLAVRVFAQGAGENAARYGMTLDGELLADDTVLEFAGFKVYIDRESLEFVRDAEIDYQEGLMGAGFTMQSPHYVQPSGCGCGGNCSCGGHH